MSGDITPYTGVITSEHQGQPRFTAAVSASCQPFADAISVLNGLVFDLDTSVGDQLDKVGEWVGHSRFLPVALTGVFFSLDTAGLGFDQGVLFGPFDTGTQLTRLPDEPYRTLLRTQVLANSWDGTIPGAYAIYALLFPNGNFVILIQDGGDMSMLLVMVGNPDALTAAMFTNGLLTLRPAGVLEQFAVINTVIFALDVVSGVFGGFDLGSWLSPQLTPPTLLSDGSAGLLTDSGVPITGL